ncbi:META domain-containing protein [Pseudoalteromonas ostreae]|uniref:META domain-containing protein n=1 Tax=Pseudoalteromonas ostreae TaxID=2774154 RepID=UPI001B35C5A2|nr:META domain-containing protein [Pseudoalteromonas ostreae]
MLSNKPYSVLKSIASISLLASSAMVLNGCERLAAPQTKQTNKDTAMATLTIQVSYLDRSMLPPSSQLTVTLADVSKMDTEAEIISQQTVDINSAPPYTVELSYDASKMQQRHRYSVMARITNQDQLLYVSTTHNNPFEQSQQAPYEVVVSKVAAPKPNVDLVNTYFKAVTLNGVQVTVETKEPFIQFSKDNKSHGFLGCNNFAGSYQADQQTLTFSPQASTRKMCSQGMEQEAAMSGVLENTATWDINGESLTLKDKQGKVLATFKAVYFN